MSDCISFNTLKKEIIRKVTSNVNKSLIRFMSVFNGQKNMKMPDIPFDIQTEIIKRLPVEPLVRFRSVSKQWKSFIDSSEFIKTYQPRSCSISSILSYRQPYSPDLQRYICYDNNNQTLKKAVVLSPLFKQYRITDFVCASHGLLCFYGLYLNRDRIVVICNPSIRKSIAIITHGLSGGAFLHCYFGFGVCSVTKDLIVVNLTYRLYGMLSGVEVFTLSSGVWTEIPTSKCPRRSIKLNGSTNVVIDDRFIYWAAYEYTNDNARNLMLVSFDLITKEFRVLDLPKSLTNELYGSSPMSISKLRESLVVYGCIKVEEALCCGVWLMEHDSSFTKLFTISANVGKILGFKKSGEPIFEAYKEYGEPTTTLDVYDPRSQQIQNLGIVRRNGSFFIRSYKESLLLLDHSDLQIYPYR